jgi:radical SAM protein with 4Fe4S-binding SPASM domain
MNKRRLKKAVKRLSSLPLNHYLFFYLANKVRHYWLKATGSTWVAKPSTLMLELTNQCNLACTTCAREYGYGKEMDKGMMDFENAQKIIDSAWPYLDSIGLTGMGETFLYKRIDEITNYIKKRNKGIIISVSTNAQVPDFIEKIKPLINKIDTIQVSIDGLGKTYESIRKKASFTLLDKNLRQLAGLCRNSKTDVMLNMVVTKENFNEMSALVEYAATTGIPYVDFTLFNLAAVTDIEPSYYRFYESAGFLKAVDLLNEVSTAYPQVIITNRNFSTSNGFRSCPFPWTHFYICWNGYVAPCCAKPFPKELHFGNVFEKGLMPVLNSDAFRKFREQWFKNQTPPFCQKCHFIYHEFVK